MATVIIFEGPRNTGKSTQLKTLKRTLEASGRTVFVPFVKRHHEGFADEFQKTDFHSLIVQIDLYRQWPGVLLIDRFLGSEIVMRGYESRNVDHETDSEIVRYGYELWKLDEYAKQMLDPLQIYLNAMPSDVNNRDTGKLSEGDNSLKKWWDDWAQRTHCYTEEVDAARPSAEVMMGVMRAVHKYFNYLSIKPIDLAEIVESGGDVWLSNIS